MKRPYVLVCLVHNCTFTWVFFAVQRLLGCCCW